MISKTVRILIVLTMFMGVFAYAPAAIADDINETKGFRKAVTLAGIREHQAAFQSFSDAGGGNRVSGGAGGFDASAQYVFDRMAAAGYNVSFQEFTFLFNADRTPPEFEQVSPAAVPYVDGVDFFSMTFSGNGEVTADVTAVDLVIPPVGAENGNTSGCEASDFAGFPAGDIALMQRGTCPFGTKAANALAAGASAAIIFNEGQTNRTAAFQGTLGAPVNLATIGTSFALGSDLANGVLNGPTGSVAHVRVDRINENRTTRNVIAETPTGDPNRVIVIGAHLDSVPRGPGINDNGSGSATILEVAEVFAQQGRVPRSKLRFMWYAAEEFGLIGSTYYVNNLSQVERDKIELMLNFDMIGSPNFMRGIYDGDNSAFPPGPNVQVGPPGSGEIERVFTDYFTSQGLHSQPTPFSGRSDYGPFITIAGIPAGGLFTGAEGTKTAQEAAIYGGIAGAQYDPCYHLACDTFAGTGSGAGSTAPGLALTALDQMSDAVAHAVLLFSKRNFDKDPLATPTAAPAGKAVTTASGSDSGPHPAHDHDEAIDQ
jgi:Zn-dependent M28 family amino/carboxypeptidase